MPISQATILAVYGDLCDLVEKVETLSMQALEADLFTAQADREKAVAEGIKALRLAAIDAQKTAIAHIMAEAPEYSVHPLTGRIDE